MQKEIKGWFLFLCILLLCIFFVGTSRTGGQKQTPAYILSVYDGCVAVFPYDGGPPLQVLETRIAALPPSEAERLKKGIAAADDEALQRLIEDYCS